jgi:hypothetical protein
VSSVETASERAGEYIAEVVAAQTLDALYRLYAEAARADVGELALGLIVRACAARKAALLSRDGAQLALLESSLGGVVVRTRSPIARGIGRAA